jgi:adenylate cyclase, class 2
MTDRTSPREIETKFRLVDRADFEKRLSDLGAVEGSTEFESNVLLDDAAGTLRTRGQALRLRDSAGASLLTFKGKATFERGIKSRVEIESGVQKGENVAKVFEALGFTPVFRYEKRRTTWRFTDPALPLVVVDETPIGLFAEIEGSEPAVRALATRLGVDEAQMIEQSYPMLYREARERNPELPADMTFRDLPSRPDRRTP